MEAVSLVKGPTRPGISRTASQPSFSNLPTASKSSDICSEREMPDGNIQTVRRFVVCEPTSLQSSDDAFLGRLDTSFSTLEIKEPKRTSPAAGRNKSSYKNAQEIEPWVTAIKAHYTRLSEHAEAVSPKQNIEGTLWHAREQHHLQLILALQEQLPFCLSELPALPLSVTQLASLVCWLCGASSMGKINSPLPDLFALFSILLEQQLKEK